jgi:hypothetical protein
MAGDLGPFDGVGAIGSDGLGSVCMTYVVDVKDPRNEESLEGFPMTLADEEIRDWWATLCRGPVTDLPTADEVAIEYALSHEGNGSVAVIHKDGGGDLIDTGLFAREIR